MIFVGQVPLRFLKFWPKHKTREDANYPDPYQLPWIYTNNSFQGRCWNEKDTNSCQKRVGTIPSAPPCCIRGCLAKEGLSSIICYSVSSSKIIAHSFSSTLIKTQIQKGRVATNTTGMLDLCLSHTLPKRSHCVVQGQEGGNWVWSG